MHDSAYAWLHRTVHEQIGSLRTARVLEIGSFDVNGTPRPIFAQAKGYTGVDIRKGPAVDVVADLATPEGAEALSGQRFSVVVSAETLEHAANPAGLLEAAWELLEPDGWLLLTAAAPERAPHSVDGSPRVPIEEHYAGIDPAWLRSRIKLLHPARSHVAHFPERGDVYAYAQKKAAPEEAEEPKKAAAKE